jgi:hypothetical protein
MDSNPYESPVENGEKAKAQQLPILLFVLVAVAVATIAVSAWLVVLRG